MTDKNDGFVSDSFEKAKEEQLAPSAKGMPKKKAAGKRSIKAREEKLSAVEQAIAAAPAVFTDLATNPLPIAEPAPRSSKRKPVFTTVVSQSFDKEAAKEAITAVQATDSEVSSEPEEDISMTIPADIDWSELDVHMEAIFAAMSKAVKELSDPEKTAEMPLVVAKHWSNFQKTWLDDKKLRGTRLLRFSENAASDCRSLIEHVGQNPISLRALVVMRLPEATKFPDNAFAQYEETLRGALERNSLFSIDNGLVHLQTEPKAPKAPKKVAAKASGKVLGKTPGKRGRKAGTTMKGSDTAVGRYPGAANEKLGLTGDKRLTVAQYEKLKPELKKAGKNTEQISAKALKEIAEKVGIL